MLPRWSRPAADAAVLASVFFAFLRKNKSYGAFDSLIHPAHLSGRVQPNRMTLL
jgi:hypothetical protein